MSSPANEGLILVVMDLQNDFCHPDGLYGQSGTFAHVPAAAAEVLPRILPVIRACKAARIPVVASKLRILTDLDGRGIGLDQFRPQLQALFTGAGFRAGSWGQDLVQELHAPDVSPDYPFDKWGHSAMYLTGMEKILRALQARKIIFVGLATNGVVEGTVRDAVARGWRVWTLSDCVAAPQQELHEASLLNLSHLGQLTTSAEFLTALAAGRAAD
jgi:ureidoacrylate peracid hydrolase